MHIHLCPFLYVHNETSTSHLPTRLFNYLSVSYSIYLFIYYLTTFLSICLTLTLHCHLSSRLFTYLSRPGYGRRRNWRHRRPWRRKRQLGGRNDEGNNRGNGWNNWRRRCRWQSNLTLPWSWPAGVWGSRKRWEGRRGSDGKGGKRRRVREGKQAEGRYRGEGKWLEERNERKESGGERKLLEGRQEKVDDRLKEAAGVKG